MGRHPSAARAARRQSPRLSALARRRHRCALALAVALWVLGGCARHAQPTARRPQPETVSRQWRTSCAGARLPARAASTDRGGPAVRWEVGRFAGRPVTVYCMSPAGRTLAGQQRAAFVFRLSGWDGIRYLAYGLHSPDMDLMTTCPSWRAAQGEWTHARFETSQLFYRPGYRRLLNGGGDGVSLRFVVRGTPGPHAAIELGAGEPGVSDIPDPLTAAIALEAGGRRLIVPRDRDAACRYFARKPRASPPMGRKRFHQVLTPQDCVRRADEMAGGRYQVGAFRPALLPGDLAWTEEPFHDINWQFAYHNLSFLEAPLGAFQATGERRYLEMATRIAADWFCDDMVDSDPLRPTWNDAATAVRITVLLDLWETCRTAGAQPEFLCDLLRAIRLHGTLLAAPDFYAKDAPSRYTNHALLQDVGLAAAAYALPELEEAKQWAGVAARRSKMHAEKVITSEGVHVENSPSYHLAIMAHIAGLAEMLKGSGSAESAYLARRSRQMEHFAAHLIAPSGDTLLFGDSKTGTAQLVLPYVGASRALTYVESQGRMGRPPEDADAVFPKSGYAFFRDRWGGPDDFGQTTYLAFTAAYNSTTHKHFDDLSFVAYALGEWWLVDPGLYTYNRDDPFYAYARSFPAHNTIVVDGRTPELRPADVGKSRIDRWATGDALAYVEAHHTLIPGVTARRGLYYLKPNVLLVLDEIESEGEHAITFPLHLAAHATVRPDGSKRWTVRSRNTGRGMTVEAVWPDVKARVVQGQTAPVVQGWVFPNYRERLPAPVLELSTRGRSLRLLTVLELPSGGMPPSSARDVLEQRAAEFPQLQPVRDLWAERDRSP